MGQRVVRWTLQLGLLLKTKGTTSQQVELRGDGGERGFSLSFSLSSESESGSSLVFIAVIQLFVSVLEEGSMPKVLAINVLNFFQPLLQ